MKYYLVTTRELLKFKDGSQSANFFTEVWEVEKDQFAAKLFALQKTASTRGEKLGYTAEIALIFCMQISEKDYENAKAVENGR